MLKITPVSAAQAKGYYEKDDYYAQDLEQESLSSMPTSEWFGELANQLGLEGRVEAEVFQRLLEGETEGGRSLHAKGINLEKHRAGYDCTFSAPKSYSIAALLADERLVELQQEAVKTALSIAQERYAQDREWNVTEKKQEAVVTGNFAVALFLHDTSRNLDPNLHTHAVVLNGTEDANGNYRALHTDEIFAHRKLLDQVYLNELAYGAQQLGYEIELTTDGFELKGYEPELLDSFSSRRKEIEAHVNQQVENGLQEAGWLYERAALETRKRKQTMGREVLVDSWQQVIAKQGLELPLTPIAPSEVPVIGTDEAAIAAREGINHAAEREAVFKRGKVEQFALGNHLGQQSWSRLQAAIQKTGQLIQADKAKDKYTTHQAIARELETIQFMEQGKGRFEAIASLDEVEAIAPETLTKGQRQAIEFSVTTQDQIIGWQGFAGSGKTFALNLYRQLAEENGYHVRGFAPSAESANVLGEEAAIESDTVASLIYARPADNLLEKEIWIVDEAGMLGAKDAHALLQRAAEQQTRVILVGDTKQLSAVEAGNPFKSLQSAGMPTASLEESLRQKSERLQWAVEAIARGDLSNGFDHFHEAGSIRGVETQEERQHQIVADYLALSSQRRDKTLLIVNTNRERTAITQGIREGLQAAGELGEDLFMLTSLKSKDLTVAQAKYAKSYGGGDVIVPTQDYLKQKLMKGEHYEVVEVEPDANRLTLQSSNGEQFKIDPSRCDRKSVYECQLVPLAPGDQLKWTRNDPTQGRRNGQQFVVDALMEDGQAIARYPDGTTELIDLNGRQFADYSLVTTTYSSQGKTADRVLAALDSSTGKESFYVAASRAKYELTLYTTDEAELRKLATQSRAQENASDYLDLFTYQEQRVKNATHEIRTTETDPGRFVGQQADHSASGGFSIGSRVGERLAATLSGSGEDSTSARDFQLSLEGFNQTSGSTGVVSERIDPQLRDFEQDSLREIQRVNEELDRLHQYLERQRVERLKQKQIQAERAEQITPIAQQLFEHYAAKDAENGIIPGDAEQVYHLEIKGTEYRLSLDQATETHNVQREGTDLDLLSQQGITEEDVENWRSVPELLEQDVQREEETAPVPAAPRTLAEATTLTLETWKQMTPRQQIKLVYAANAHQRREPRVTVEVEQWVGQEAQVKQQLKKLNGQHSEEQKALKELEAKGQRQLFNPFGATADQLFDARDSVLTTRRVWEAQKTEYDRIQERRNQRQKQESDRQTWSALPETHGAQRLGQLLESPDVQSQYDAVHYQFQQLDAWSDVAKPLGYSETDSQKIREFAGNYLDGRQIPAEILDLMRNDLKEYQQYQCQQQRDHQLEL
jgi:conjugative relaxase-like TrwC/TraI family protein